LAASLTDASSPGSPSVPPPRLPTNDRRGPVRSFALSGLLFIGILAGVYAMRNVFVPLTFAVMLYFLLRPAVRWLARHRVPRLIGSGVVLGSVIALLAFAVLELAGPAVVWAQRLPEAVEQVELKSRALRHPIEHASQAFSSLRSMAEVEGGEMVPKVALARPGWLQGMMEGAAELMTQVALTIIAAYFLLIDGDTLFGRLFRLAPSLPERTTMVINEVGVRMSQYLRTVTMINLGLGAILTLVLYALGMPNPWLWGALAAVLTYVPYLGPAVGIALVALASFVTFPTAASAAAPPIAYFILSSLEGNFVTPLVLGRAFRLSPLVVFVWLSLWVWLWSVPGAILAVPMLMLIKIICDESPSASVFSYLIGK
jgi:predicted PurR-regulated permease PerM